MTRSFSGLRTEIVASVALLTLVAIVLVTTLLIQTLEQDTLSRQMRIARDQIRVLRSALSEMMGETEDIPEEALLRGNKLIAQSSGEQRTSLLWVNRHGEVMGARGEASVEDLSLDSDLKVCLTTGQETTRIGGGDSLWPFWGIRALVLTAPIMSRKGEVLGALRMESPLQGMWARLIDAGWVLGFYVLVVMGVLILFGSYLISRNVLQPLKRLIDASEQIALGDYDLHWEGYPSHEMGRLADALRRMADELRAQQAAMARQVEELERSNKALVQAHQALVRSEKLASVGRLAAGLAHEIGNPIGSILGYVEVLSSAHLEQVEKDCVHRIGTEAERVQRTLGSLLDMARPAARRLQWVDVDEVVEDTLAMMTGHKEMKGIELVRVGAGGLPPIWADRDQIQQVLVNILINALDAMDGSGTLTVRTDMAEQLPDDQEVMPPPRRSGEPDDTDFTPLRRRPPQTFWSSQGPYAFIEATDTGSGIPPESIQHVFEPFFTTKEPGKGTGIGLTVCLGIVESYGGRIHVRSRMGEGTCFAIYLPVGGAQGESGAQEARDNRPDGLGRA